MVHVSDYPAHFFEGVGLHQDKVLGEEESGDLREFPDRRGMGVRDDGSQLVEGVVQVVHSSSFAGVDAQTNRFRVTIAFRVAVLISTRLGTFV